MSDTLTKDILREATGEQVAVPGISPSPAYCVDHVVTTPTYKTVFYTKNDGTIVSILVSTGLVSSLSHDCYPAQPGSPGTPGIAATTSVNYNLGWTGGAQSIASMAADGQFQFSINANSIGVVCGFNDANLTADYREIDFAIYGTHGQCQVIENGVRRTDLIPFSTGDVFTIRRLGTEIAYFKGATKLYTSTVRTAATLIADSSLYSGGDQILNPSLSGTVAAGFRGTSGGTNASGSTTTTTTDSNGEQGDGVGGVVRMGADLGVLYTFGSDRTGAVSTAKNVLRDMVTTGQSINRGSTGVGGGTPGTGTDGDWSGRGGPQLIGLVSQGVGHVGTDKSFASGSSILSDPFAGGGLQTIGSAYSTTDAPLTPQFVIGNSGLSGLATFGVSIKGLSASGQSVLGGLHSFGGNRTGAQTRSDGEAPSEVDANGDWNGRGGAQLRGLVTEGYDSTAVVSDYLLGVVPHRFTALILAETPQTLDGDGNPVDFGIVASVPVPTFQGQGGGSLRGAVPVPTFAGTGSASDVGSIKQLTPVPTFSGTLKVTVVGGLDATWRPKVTLRAFGGGVLHASTPALTGTLAGVMGRSGVIAARVPRVTFQGSGDTPVFGAIIGTVPMLRMVSGGVLVATVPRITFVGRGQSTITAEYEAYSLTLLDGDNGVAASRYTTFPFSRILRFGNTYYGVAADGLYALAGDSFDGVPIVATVAFPTHDFGTPNLKRGRALHLTGRIGGDVAVTATVHEDGTPKTYRYRPASQKSGAHNHRVLIGRGLVARYWSFALTNTKGEDFALEEAAAEFDGQRRTVWD